MELFWGKFLAAASEMVQPSIRSFCFEGSGGGDGDPLEIWLEKGKSENQEIPQEESQFYKFINWSSKSFMHGSFCGFIDSSLQSLGRLLRPLRSLLLLRRKINAIRYICFCY